MGTKQTAEFRQEVVRVALTSGLSRKQVASDFGIGFSTLCRWLKKERSQVLPSEPQIDLIQEKLKAFGQIIKSMFILRYVDDLALRLAIEKQHNKVELANRFRGRFG